MRQQVVMWVVVLSMGLVPAGLMFADSQQSPVENLDKQIATVFDQGEAVVSLDCSPNDCEKTKKIFFASDVKVIPGSISPDPQAGKVRFSVKAGSVGHYGALEPVLVEKADGTRTRATINEKFEPRPMASKEDLEDLKADLERRFVRTLEASQQAVLKTVYDDIDVVEQRSLEAHQMAKEAKEVSRSNSRQILELRREQGEMREEIARLRVRLDDLTYAENMEAWGDCASLGSRQYKPDKYPALATRLQILERNGISSTPQSECATLLSSGK